MRRVEKIIKESYLYNNFTEFQEHRKLMVEKGYIPSNTTKEGYSNTTLENYYGEYSIIVEKEGG